MTTTTALPAVDVAFITCTACTGRSRAVLARDRAQFDQVVRESERHADLAHPGAGHVLDVTFAEGWGDSFAAAGPDNHDAHGRLIAEMFPETWSTPGPPARPLWPVP